VPDARFDGWPAYWFGSANAWLVFIGPSPGDSPSASPVNWKRDRLPTLGKPNEHLATYRDGRGFWPRMRAWVGNAFAGAGIFTEPGDAWAVTMVGNLASSAAGDASTIPADELRRGLRATSAALKLVQPRLVVPLHKRVTELLLPLLSGEGWIETARDRTDVPALNQRFTLYKPNWFELTRGDERMLVAEAPQHPSRTNFYDPKEMDIYLANLVMRAAVDT
jgi:hypothetical protein